MIGIVIVAHGGLAQEYKAAMEHVVGTLPNVAAIGISAECDRGKKTEQIRQAVQQVETGNGVILVTDMYGGSPANLSLPACSHNNHRVLYGANLPMLLKLAKCRANPIDVAITKAVEAGRKYLNCLPVQPLETS